VIELNIFKLKIIKIMIESNKWERGEACESGRWRVIFSP
jgi:hypothetical protein